LQVACCRAPCKLSAGKGEEACLTWRRLGAQYGRIRNIDLKIPPRPPAFAFVEFENPRCVGSVLAGVGGPTTMRLSALRACPLCWLRAARLPLSGLHFRASAQLELIREVGLICAAPAQTCECA